MFNTDSIIKEVNVFNKLFCYLIIFISLLMVKEALFLVFANLILLVITKQYPKLLKFNILVLGITVLGMFYPQFLWITKIGILMIYTILLKKVMCPIELRYVLENTLYCFKQKQVTYKILSLIYFGRYFKNNLKRFLILKDDYGLKVNPQFMAFILRQAYEQTKEQMQEFMIMNRLRFYNDSTKRTYIERKSWESWDNNYIIIHAMIFLLTFFYGR